MRQRRLRNLDDRLDCYENRVDIDRLAVKGHWQEFFCEEQPIYMELGSGKAANIVMLGAILRETGVVSPDSIRTQMVKMFSGRKEKYLAMNQAAFDLYL